MKKTVLLLVCALSIAAFAQDTTKKADDPSKIVPTLDAELGPCSADFHVVDMDGKNAYGAHIHVLIKSRAFGIKKTDLQLATNYDGKAKFTGLPDVNKRPTTFEISKDGKRSVQPFEPGENCHPTFEITLGKDFVLDTGKK